MSAKILIADDELGIRTALSILLQEEGYEIKTVCNGREALEAIRGEHFDLVISDVRMPGMNGLDLLIETSKLILCPEIIIMTAYANIEMAISALKNGARDFLIKPFANDVLINTVRRVLKLHELSQENKKLHELEKMKKEFITMIAHELRTPLTAIKGYLKLVLSGLAGEIKKQQKEYLDVVYQNSQRLQEIITKMIDIGSLELSDFFLDSKATHIRSLVWDSIVDIQKSIEAKQLKVEVNMEPIATPIVVDPFRMKQITTFLLENAIAFSCNGNHIWITVRKWQGKDALLTNLPISYVDFDDLEKIDYLEISIRDEGLGIPEDKLSMIFEKFYQIEDLHTRKVSGLGVGLSLCKKLVTIMGGKIWVTSVVEQGSTFSFILPWNKPEENSALEPIKEAKTENSFNTCAA